MSRSSWLLRSVGAAIVLALLGALWGLGIHGTRQFAGTLVGSYALLWLLVIFLSPRVLSTAAERFVLVTLGLGSAWMFIEVIGLLGMVDYRNLLVPPRTAWDRPENAYHQEMRFVRRPYLSMSGTSPGNISELWGLGTEHYRYDVRYDGRGFRNDRDVSEADVVVLGDSYIESPLVSGSQIATSVLASLTDLEVTNVALAGWGPGEQLAALKLVGTQLRPRVVIWAFFEGNDPENLQGYLDWVARGRPAPMAQQRWSLARSAALRIVDLARPADPGSSTQVGLFRTETGIEVPTYFIQPPRRDDLFLQELRPTLEEAHGVVRDLGALLVFVFVPLKFRVYHDSIELPTESSLHGWHVGDLPERMRAWVESVSSQIVFLDATVPLADAAARGEMVYLPDDTHWSAAGHRVVAEAWAAMLREYGEIDRNR